MEIRKLAIRAISRIAMESPTTHIETNLIQVLNSTDPRTRIAALTLIRHLTGVAFSNIIFVKVFDSLEDKKSGVCAAAADALIITSSTEHKDQAIRKLISLTKDKRFSVRFATLRSLMVLSKSSINKQIISEVISALDDNSDLIRIMAMNLIANYADKFSTTGVIEKLLKSLRGHFEESRFWTTSLSLRLKRGLHRSDPRIEITQIMVTLAQLGGQVKSELVFNELFRILKLYPWMLDGRFPTSHIHNINFEVALIDFLDSFWVHRRFREHRFMNYYYDDYMINEDEVTVQLSNTSASHNSIVILGKQLTADFVTNKLLDAVSDNQVEVRVQALKLISELHEKIDAHLVESKIISTLQDKERTVRIASISAAESIWYKTKRKSISEAIIKRLNEEDSEVREKAWDVLQRIKLSEFKAVDTAL